MIPTTTPAWEAGMQEQPGPEAGTPWVIVPLDGTARATAALPVARALAELEQATLVVVHVAAPAVSPRELIRKLGLTHEQLHGSVLRQAQGAPGEGILRLAAERPETSVVMVTHTDEGKPRGYVGSVTHQVLQEATVPVILVRPEPTPSAWTLRRILLPHDGTPTTAAAVHPALDLAQRAGAELMVLHATSPGMAPAREPGTLHAPRYVDQPQHEWPTWAREFIARVRSLGHSPETQVLRLLLGQGQPGPQIIKTASSGEADLIVLAWHGSWNTERAVTLKTVIAEAPCPVLVLRIPPEHALA